MARKREIERPYPPDYVSIETLAYRLDYSQTTILDYVRRRLLPKPKTVGAGQRWCWQEVQDWIGARNGAVPLDSRDLSGFDARDEDPFLKDLKRGQTADA